MAGGSTSVARASVSLTGGSSSVLPSPTSNATGSVLPSSTSPRSGMTTSEKIGLGVGLPIGFAVIGLLTFLYTRERYRRLASERRSIQPNLDLKPTSPSAATDTYRVTSDPQMLPTWSRPHELAGERADRQDPV
ncbi:MAG: hypothetical protein M1839_007534 [Geoglossum umbratile]|nr:MAG: hypothetical protein M1839_007534 [Geoglossum umbratile]